MKPKILDYIDFEKVNTLLEGFNKSTGFVTAILDLEGNVLSKSGWREICTEFHRMNPESSEKCRISDTELANKMLEGEKYHFYKCLNGLVDVAVPVLINGDHIANIFSGQFFFEKPDLLFFKKQAEKYGFDEEKYLKALQIVPVVSKEKVIAAMDFLLDMTRLINEMSFQKLEQLQLNEALRRSEERSRNVLDNLLEGCQIIGFDWKYIYLNNTAGIHNRRPNMELTGNRYMDVWPGIEETEIFKAISQTLRERGSSHFENEFVFPDGSRGWFDLSIQPVPEGVFILSIDITERKKIENALRENEEKYRLISDNSDDWIYWIIPDGHFRYISPACERVTGYSPEEFASQPELNHEIVLRADRKKFKQHSIDIKQDDTPHNLEFRIVTKNGEIRWINHSCSPIFNNEGEFLGRLGTNRNITERKNREEQLFESEFRFRKLYENGPIGMVFADKDFRFIKANSVFCTITGYSEAELQNLTFKDISHPDDLVKDLKNVRMLNNKEIAVYRTEKRYTRKDGQMIWGSLTVTATFDSEGQFLYNLGIIEDITHRKSSEDEIKRLNERITTATRASQIGIWDWDVENNRLTWDDQMYALYGLKKGEFAGAYEAWIKGLHPDDREFCREEVRLALIGEKEYDPEFRVVWPDGTIRYCKAKGDVFQNETGEPVRMVGINFDITEQKRNNEKIREKDLQFRKLSANVPDLIFQFTRKPDGSYCVPVASEGIRNIFGCSPEDVVDDFTPIASVIYPEDAERVISEIEFSANHLTYFTCEFRVHIPGKPVQWILSRSTPERLPDGSITWYGFNADITYRKEAEEAIQLLNSELEQRVVDRTSQLEAANKELEAFSYSVSHDLRAPLRHINGFAELLTGKYSDLLPEEAGNYLNTITGSTKKMGILIDDLLSFSRTGRAVLKKSNLKMNQVVEDALTHIQPLLKDRKIDWEILLLPEIQGDYNLLRLAWINLLDNAVKYTQTRKDAIIKIGSRDDNRNVVFYIQDNGVGFDMKYADKLFGVFQRLHSSSQFDGTGIGLANVQRIILRHGGRIWAEAEPDKGAAFYFSIPKYMED